MRRLVLAAVVALGALTAAPAAQACTLDTCPGTSLVCDDVVRCHVCYYQPPSGTPKCIT